MEQRLMGQKHMVETALHQERMVRSSNNPSSSPSPSPSSHPATTMNIISIDYIYTLSHSSFILSFQALGVQRQALEAQRQHMEADARVRAQEETLSLRQALEAREREIEAIRWVDINSFHINLTCQPSY